VGVPTLVDPVRGIVYNAANISSWTEVYLKDFLQDRFGVRAEVNNDANCYALGASALLGHPCHVTVGVTLGTGTGIGIVVDGKLMCGENCGSGELCSVPYLDSEYESYCSKKFFTAAGLDGRKAAEAAAAGDPAVLQFFKDFGHHMGELLTLIMYAYDPGCIVLGGGIANTAPWFKDSMMETLRSRYIYPRSIDRLQIKVMPEDNVALLGASLL
jgi:glucokinase